jgi:hypothetical protein
MKKALIAIAMVGALAGSQASAQVSNFAGYSAGVNLDFSSSTAEINTGGLSAKVGDASQNVSLYAAYGFDLRDRVVLGLGLSYSLTSLKSGSVNMAGTRVEWQNHDIFSAYIEPGYALNNDTLLYAKIAYVGAKGERISNGVTNSQNYYGAGYGAGARVLLTRHLYLQGEFMRAEYGERPIDGMPHKPASTTGSLGLGYKF